MKVLAGPEDVCKCGHTKTFHAWLRTEDMDATQPLVRFERCGAKGCDCPDYSVTVEDGGKQG